MSWFIRVSRKWSRKNIEIRLMNKGIEIDMPLDEFLTAMCHEAQFRFTRAGQLAEILAAADKVIDATKQETAKQPLFGTQNA